MTDLTIDNISRKITFIEIFNVPNIEFVEIPIIQRDYAQGRKEVKEVRDVFLNALYDALTRNNAESEHTLNLDFVYGSIDDNTFSVLDGQQRLTTLFLLHWFLAIKNYAFDDFRQVFTKDNYSRFTYKTRKSSIEFFDALTSDDNFIKKFNQSKAIQKMVTVSEVIKDCNWFYLSWKQDPTVQGCLNMLDDIETKFTASKDNLYLRLVDIKNPYITFQFLPLNHFGLSDELYIKMNARGKPLTQFEHFKAILEQAIKTHSDALPTYELEAKGGIITAYEYFIHKIDTDWADLFWTYRKVGGNDETFDDEVMNFIRLFILYQYILNSEDNSSDVENNVDKKMFRSEQRRLKLNAVPISVYKELKVFNPQFIEQLISLLNLLETKRNHKLKTYLPIAIQQKYYSEETMFEKVLSDVTTYEDKLRFYAFYSFLHKNIDLFDDDSIEGQLALTEWIRVVYNLTENTIINGVKEFNSALVSIDKLGEYDSDILKGLAENPNLKISTFTQDQLLEEKIKAHLILKSEAWRDVILQAEAHLFFDGQIGFLFNFSGILEFYLEHYNCDWSDIEDIEYLATFKTYFASAGAVFEYVGDSSAKANYLWERAVLSKGIYLTKQGYEKYNLLSTRLTKNHIARDHSWKRLLRIDAKYLDKQAYVKAVLDDSNFDETDVKLSLEQICHNSIEDDTLDVWRKALIQYPKLFDYSKQGFIVYNDEEIYLIKEMTRGSSQYEIHTKVLDFELSDTIKDNPDYLRPFNKMRYLEVADRHSRPCLQLADYTFEGQNFNIEIFKGADAFEIVLVNSESLDYPEALVEVLKKLGFYPYESDEESDEKEFYYENTEETTLEDVLNKLEETLDSLRESVA